MFFGKKAIFLILGTAIAVSSLNNPVNASLIKRQDAPNEPTSNQPTITTTTPSAPSTTSTSQVTTTSQSSTSTTSPTTSSTPSSPTTTSQTQPTETNNNNNNNNDDDNDDDDDEPTTTNSSSPTNTNSTPVNTPSTKSSSGSKLSGGAIAGIAVGGAAGLIFIAAIVYGIMKSREKEKFLPPMFMDEDVDSNRTDSSEHPRKASSTSIATSSQYPPADMAMERSGPASYTQAPPPNSQYYSQYAQYDQSDYYPATTAHDSNLLYANYGENSTFDASNYSSQSGVNYVLPNEPYNQPNRAQPTSWPADVKY